ncbi:GapS4b family protein [Aeromonas sp. 603757]|uniref:GapS4b family protein n=1 Tax=Aeromonas sp. 603757 TaxID=2712050 RepID=UPI003BA2ED44
MGNKKYLLPYGDALRDFLNNQGITKSDLRSILRRRGVFTASDEKSEQVPILVRTGITPPELSILLDRLRVKEDNPKIHTQTVKCTDNKLTLKAMIPSNFNIESVVNKPFSNYRLLGIPSFKSVGGDNNHLELEFTIERFDYTKSWDKNTSQFSGKVKLKKVGSSVDMNITLSHTSPETKEVANGITSKLIKEMKSSGAISEREQIKKIQFSDFTNENRVLFLKMVSQEQITNELYFKDTKDIGFSPDDTQTLPKDIAWMEKTISNLVLQGVGLHSTFFVKNKSYHKYIKMHRLEAAYTFDHSSFNGTCNIIFEFPEYITKGDISSELSIKISGLRFGDKNDVSMGKVKEILLSQLDVAKLKYYEELASEK